MQRNQNILEVHGVKVYADKEVISPRVYESLSESRYEFAELEILKRTFITQDKYLELGGGIGVTGITAARIVESQPIVVEPDPNLCDLLSINAELNGVNLKILRGAVEVDAKEKPLFLNQGDFRASSCRNSNGECLEIIVPIFSLDKLLMEYKPSYLMCDIEGSEVEVLGSSSLEGIRKICIEFHPQIRGEKRISTLSTHLKDLGFNSYRSFHDENVLFFAKDKNGGL